MTAAGASSRSNFGALRGVITSTTLGARSAAAVSSARIRLLAIGLVANTP
jgi:hypothetical protein